MSLTAAEHNPQDTTTTTMSQPQTDAPILKVDFTWKKWKINITEISNDNSTPYMIVDCNLRKPHLEFKSQPSNKTVGGGNVHAVSIHADYDLRGEAGQLRALSKFKTKYTHLSKNYGTPTNPMEMSWTTSSSFTDWDFICLDSSSQPVARFNSSFWAVRKLGNIEFLGPKANDAACREEIVVVGLTLWYTMVFRMNNILNFFGAIFASTGPIKQGDQVEGHAPAVQMDDMSKTKVV